MGLRLWLRQALNLLDFWLFFEEEVVGEEGIAGNSVGGQRDMDALIAGVWHSDVHAGTGVDAEGLGVFIIFEKIHVELRENGEHESEFRRCGGEPKLIKLLLVGGDQQEGDGVALRVQLHL